MCLASRRGKNRMYIENGDTPTGCVPDKKTISLLCILRKQTSYMHVAIKELLSDSQASHFSFASPSVYVLRRFTLNNKRCTDNSTLG